MARVILRQKQRNPQTQHTNSLLDLALTPLRVEPCSISLAPTLLLPPNLLNIRFAPSVRPQPLVDGPEKGF